MRPAWEVFGVGLRLGVTSFGGPIAHIGYFRGEYVQRRQWLSDAAFAELVAVAQFLPGPTSVQVGMAVGHIRAGFRGALAAGLGFALPSAILMTAFAVLAGAQGLQDAVWLHALKLVAVAVVLDAVISMARNLISGARTAVLALATAAAVLVLPTTGVLQVGCLAAAALLGVTLLHDAGPAAAKPLPVRVERRVGTALLVVFAGLLAALPLLSGSGSMLADLAAGMYRAGALVFGGGHVVLPLLQAQTVPDLVSQADFLAGYGAAQALPGPMFCFSAYLGQVAAGPVGAVVAPVAIFLPGFLLMFGALPFWQAIRANNRARGAMVGVNAAVVGLLAAAFVDPIVVTSVASVLDAAFAAALFALLKLGSVPPWVVVATALLLSPVLLLG